MASCQQNIGDLAKVRFKNSSEAFKVKPSHMMLRALFHGIHTS